MKKYEYIIKELNNMISSEFKGGDRLPSIRKLSNLYRVNKSTIIKALDELRDNNVVYSIQGSGYYVMHTLDRNDEIIDFSLVKPDDKLLPFREFEHSLHKAIDYYKYSIFSYTDSSGLPSLKEEIKSDLEYNQIFTNTKNICITSGAQQGINIILSIISRYENPCILVENPTYSLIFKMAKQKGIKVLTIPRITTGIDLRELESILNKNHVHLFYTNGRLQNPTGYSYDEDTKRKLVDIANKHNLTILEDDCLADLDTNAKYLPLYHYDTFSNVIYIKSYSKCFIPGLRIGAIILNDMYYDDFISYKTCADLNTSVIDQGALEVFIKSGLYNKHRKKLKSIYSSKMSQAQKFIWDHGKDIVETIPVNSGIFLWLHILPSININMLIDKLNNNNIIVANGNDFFYTQNDKNHLRLCIYNLSDDSIRNGLKAIIDEVSGFIK